MAEMETIKETVTINQDRYPYLVAGIAKLNKRARKIGCEEMVLTIETDTVNQVYQTRTGRIVKGGDVVNIPKHRIKRTWFEFDVTLEYVIPIIDGWELISTFDITPRVPILDDDGNPITDDDGITLYGERLVFTSTVPGKNLPSGHLNKNEIHCDHCGHKRFRTHSMLMRNVESGFYKEVGSTCVKDFFGHSPANLLWMAQINFTDIISELEEEHFGSGRGTFSLDIDAVLMYTAMAIRLDGWVSRGYARDYDKTPTSDNMFFYMDPPTTWKGERDPNADDIKLARHTLRYFNELNPGDNDYLANCCKVVQLGHVPLKMVGVACSMIATFKKIWKDRIEREKRPPSIWVGELLDKIQDRVTCVWSKECVSDWGVSVLYIFVNEKTGIKYKTFYTGSKWAVYQGDTMTLKGTVRAHETYNDEKSTNLTRCSVSDIIKAPEEKKDV